MGEDDPGFVVYINLVKMLYARHPIRDAVAGTVESISHITAETLYSCHKVFYNPSNLTLCAAGDVDPERVYAIAMEMLPDKPGQVPENDFGPAEDDKPSSLRQSVAMEVSAPQFLFGAKLAPAPMAAAFTPSSSSTFSATGTSMPFLVIGVRQDTSPTPRTGASCTGAVCTFEFAIAIAVAWRAASATPCSVSVLVAAKPQAPPAITRTPTPVDSVLTTFCTLSSRVITNWRR